MNTDLNRTATALSRGHTLRIQDGQGVLLQALSGRLWLTQEGDSRDIVLEAGDEVRITRPGLSLVHALREARVLVLRDAAPGLLDVAPAGVAPASAAPASAPSASAALSRSLQTQARPRGLHLSALWQ